MDMQFYKSSVSFYISYLSENKVCGNDGEKYLDQIVLFFQLLIKIFKHFLSMWIATQLSTDEIYIYTCLL